MKEKEYIVILSDKDDVMVTKIQARGFDKQDVFRNVVVKEMKDNISNITILEVNNETEKLFDGIIVGEPIKVSLGKEWFDISKLKTK